ncbi:MAG: hypothetical protein WBD02_06810 [Acidimicrobiia bacterium]
MSTTDTEVSEQDSTDRASDVVEPAAPASPVEKRSGMHPDVRNRLVLPILIPAGAALLVIGSAIAISRLFLSGHSIDVALAAILTIGVLALMASLSAAKKMQSTGNRLWIGLGIAVVLVSGLITTSYTGDEPEGAAFIEPTGEAGASIDVTAINAGAPLELSASTAPAGIVEMVGKNLPGHILEFKNPEFKGFLLEPGKEKGKIDLPAGTYTIFCVISGHQAMVADLTVE